MKKITLLFFLCIASYGYAQTLPIDFETATTWVDFDGGAVTTIANPVSNADNNSANVGQMIKNAGQVWGGSHTTLAAPMDFNNNNTFSMKVYSIKAGTKVLLKVENSGDNNINYEKEVTMTQTNAWETLTFDYSAIPTSNTYDRVVLIFDLGTQGDGSANFTFYFDDITLYNVAPPACTSGATGNTVGTDYTLVWADEFSEDGAPCHENWDYDLGGGGWGNGEVQIYTNSTDNASISGGTLKITADKDGTTYNSARIKTQNKFDFTYGKVEVRAKLPASQGTWPAIWMLGSNFPSVGWPHCGEIDIMEQTGSNKNEVLGTTHWFNTAGNNNASFGQTTAITNASTEFHTYELEWSPQDIRIFLDGVQYYIITNDNNLPFHADFFIILNVAMGGTLGGTIDPAFTQDTMEVDYVRVYQKQETPAEPTAAAPTPGHNSANVISMFSDAYTDVPVDTWNTNWSNATFEDVMIAGNATKKYTSLGFNGIETVNPGPALDVSGMTYLHMDIWTPNITNFKVKLVDFLGDGFEGGNGDTEAELTFASPAQGEWVSLHIPLSDFTNAGMTALTDVSQYIISCDPFGTGTVFIDNVYFTTEAALSTEQFDLSDVRLFPNPSKGQWTLQSPNQNITKVELFDLNGKKVLSLNINSHEVDINATHLNSGLYIARIQTDKGTGSIKLMKE